MKQDRSGSHPSRFRSLKGDQRAGTKSTISLWRAILPILLLAILGLGLVLSSSKVPMASASLQKGNAQISEEAARQIQALIAEKESRSPTQQKIDSQLIYAQKINHGQAIANGVETLEVGAEVDSQNMTVVDMTTHNLKETYHQLEAMKVEVLSAVGNSIRARVKLDDLETIAALSFIGRVDFSFSAETQNRIFPFPLSTTTQNLKFSFLFFPHLT